MTKKSFLSCKIAGGFFVTWGHGFVHRICQPFSFAQNRVFLGQGYGAPSDACYMIEVYLFLAKMFCDEITRLLNPKSSGKK